MYQIYSVYPGVVELPDAKHGDTLEVRLALDKKFHSSVNVVVCYLDNPPPPIPAESVLGYFCTETKRMTFVYPNTHHLALPDLDPGQCVPHADINVGVVDKDGEVILFEGTTSRILYHSPGAE